MDALLVALNAKYIHTSLAVRSLAAYCRSHGFSIDCLELTVNDRFERMREQIYTRRAPLVGFSCYLWNIELVLKLAEAMKKMDPSVTVFLGGPEVSHDPAELLDRCSFIDLVVCGEGEAAVRAILNQDSYEKIGGLAWRDGKTIRVNPPSPVLPLDEIPFAYFADDLPKAPQIIYYESSRGCPFSCGFCLSAGSGVRFLEEQRTIAELSFFADHNVHQVKLVDRTFNADPRRARRIFHALAALNTKTNFHFEIAAHLLDDETNAELAAAPQGRFQFEIGVQTTNPQTLAAIGRADQFARIAQVVKALREAGNIHLHLDLIAGLPHESLTEFASSFDDVFALRPHMLQLGFLKFLKGSRLRERAHEFAGVFADYPPYEVLSTDAMQASDLMKLKQCEEVLDRFYHAGHTDDSLAHLLRRASSPFSLFMRLGEFPTNRDASSPLSAVETLWAFAQAEGAADEALRALLVFDWLRPQKRGMLPPSLDASPSPQEEAAIRAFYRLRASDELCGGTQNTQAWRRCAVYPFRVDVLALLRDDECKERRCVVFFDYEHDLFREIEL